MKTRSKCFIMHKMIIWISLIALLFRVSAVLRQYHQIVKTSTSTGATAQHPATNNYSNTYTATGGIEIETVDNHHLLSSSNNYTWIGNHWVPPPGVPTFTVLQMRTYFQNRNVLFIGDSTGRRSYNTLFALINAEDFDDIDVASVERGIDVTKSLRTLSAPRKIAHCTILLFINIFVGT
jgi:hypothetical protein